jgi:hypothetical protein
MEINHMLRVLSSGNVLGITTATTVTAIDVGGAACTAFSVTNSTTSRQMRKTEYKPSLIRHQAHAGTVPCQPLHGQGNHRTPTLTRHPDFQPNA